MDVSLLVKKAIQTILLFKFRNISSINTRSIIKAKLFPKELYIAQQVKKAYIASIC